MIKIQRVTEVPGTYLFSPYHSHAEMEIDCILSGSGTYATLNAEHPICVGDVFLFNMNEIHRITVIDPGQPMEIVKIHFDPKLLYYDDYHMFFGEYMKIFYGHTAGFANRIPAGNCAAEVQALALRMEQEDTQREFRYEMMLKMDLLSIFILLMRQFGYTESAEDVPADDANYAAIAGTLRYIDKNLTQQITLDQLARVANMSKNNYIVYFKRFNGVSPYHYILTLRISRAIEMLCSTNESVTQIAYACGFNTIVSFNKTFKKITGMSPTQYAQSCGRRKQGENRG